MSDIIVKSAGRKGVEETDLQVRNIIKIDRELCTGCGQCVLDCAEGAIAIVNGKAEVASDSYCDGLGACLAGCPAGALTIERRAAEPFDEEAVRRRLEEEKAGTAPAAEKAADPAAREPGGAATMFSLKSLRSLFGMPDEPKAVSKGLARGCPSRVLREFRPAAGGGCQGSSIKDFGSARPAAAVAAQTTRRLTWPVKLRLVPPRAPFLRGARLLLAADCAAAASARFHGLASEQVVLIACPKFEDNQKMLGRLTALLREADPASVTVLRMEVPCCRGIAAVCREAAGEAGLRTEVKELVMGCDGEPRS